MQRTITARYVAWPSASFVRPGGREWERRLGLHSALSFQRAASRRTVLVPLRTSPADWSAAESNRAPDNGGVVRARVRMHWVDAGNPRGASPSNLAPAPWRG